MSRGFEDLFGPSFRDDPFTPRRVPVRRHGPHRPVRPLSPQQPRRGLRSIDGGGRDPEPEDRAPDVPEPDARAENVAREAVARAEAKHAFDEELTRAKHRIEREAERDLARQRRETIAPFLEVLDDMDRALAASDDASDRMRQGVEMIRDRFLAKLRDQGVTTMTVDGEPFDPARHEAMGVVPVSDPTLDGTVMDVLRAGYTLDGVVLRPAGVTVGRMS